MLHLEFQKFIIEKIIFPKIHIFTYSKHIAQVSKCGIHFEKLKPFIFRICSPNKPGAFDSY